MRKTFISELVRLAEHDRRIVLLTGDLGFSIVEPFEERFPDRFYNMGVAEQNMVGVATGLAEAGFLPFVYSIVTFATLRPYEFIRNGPVLHHLPVRIVGVGGGVEYGMNGATHHGLEDVALMRALTQMTIVAPVDHRHARSALRATATLPGPVYYRLGKDEAQETAGLDGSFRLGRLEQLAEGADVAIFALGPLANEAMLAAATLEAAGIGAAVLALGSISPAPVAEIERVLERFAVVVTVEAHRSNGGIGSLIAEIAGDSGSGTRIVRLGIDAIDDVVGAERFLLGRHGLTGEQIAERAARELGRTDLLAAATSGADG